MTTLGEELYRQLSGGTGRPPPPQPEPVTVNRARDILKDLGVSQRYLARETGIPRSTIGAWFRGEIAHPGAARLQTVLAKIDLGLERAWSKSLPPDPWGSGRIQLAGNREDGTARRMDLKPAYLSPGAPKTLRGMFLQGATPAELGKRLIELTTDRTYQRLLATAQYPGKFIPSSVSAGGDDGDWIDGVDYYFAF